MSCDPLADITLASPGSTQRNRDARVRGSGVALYPVSQAERQVRMLISVN
jgi:hypothetical protein